MNSALIMRTKQKQLDTNFLRIVLVCFNSQPVRWIFNILLQPPALMQHQFCGCAPEVSRVPTDEATVIHGTVLDAIEFLSIRRNWDTIAPSSSWWLVTGLTRAPTFSICSCFLRWCKVYWKTDITHTRPKGGLNSNLYWFNQRNASS